MDLRPDLIRPGLYLSSVRTEVYREVLDDHGITHILQVGFELQPTHRSHYKYLQLPISDIPEQDIVKCFPAAFKFIDSAIEAGGAALVHCQAGVSRSATVVIAYCMWKDSLSLDAAIKKVMKARSVIWPNPGFKCQLQQFEALACDATKWSGWSSQEYLSMQYGDESVGFMSHMMGGAASESLIGTGCRSDPTRALHRARMADAGASSKRNSMHELYGLAATGLDDTSVGGSRADASIGDSSSDDSSTSDSSRGSHSSRSSISSSGSTMGSHSSKSGGGHHRSSRRHSYHTTTTNDPYAAAAAAGVAALAAATAARLTHQSSNSLDMEAALMMAG